MDEFMVFWQRLPYFSSMLLDGAVTTIIVTLSALALAILGGLLLALLRLTRGPLRMLATGYIELIRGTPVLLQLFILYFGLIDLGIKLGSFQAAILGLGLNGAAYLAEVFRAGIQAIHRDQMEAGLAIGLTPLGTLRYVILPQALRIVLPPMGNFGIGLLKDTAVVSAVAAPEIMFRARQLTTETFQSGQIYFLVALLYLVLSLPLARLVRQLERRMIS